MYLLYVLSFFLNIRNPEPIKGEDGLFYGHTHAHPHVCTRMLPSSYYQHLSATAESMAYQLALQNEILGESHVELPDPNSRVPLAQTSKSNLLHYQSPKKMLSTMAPYSVSPISKTT